MTSGTLQLYPEEEASDGHYTVNDQRGIKPASDAFLSYFLTLSALEAVCVYAHP